MIIITTQCFAPKIGGIESLMTGMAEALSNLGKEVLVLADGPKQKSDNDQNYKIKRFNIWKPIRRIQKARYLKKIIHTNKVEAIFADSWKSIELINFTFNRIIVLAHGTEIPKKECNNFNGIKNYKFKRIRRSYNKAYSVIANSNYTKDLIIDSLDIDESKIRIIHPGIDLYETKIKDEEVIEIRNLVNQKKPVIVTLARLEERKGHKFIIKAISEIIHKFPNLLYVIAGRGPYEKNLRDYARKLNIYKNIVFLGWITEPEKSILLDLSDVFAMTPIEVGQSVEGFGMVYIDAAFHGLPSLGSDSGGISDAIINNETGLLCSSGNQNEITKNLEKLLTDKELCLKLGRRGKELAFEKHTWKNKINEYLDVSKKFGSGRGI